MEAIKKKIADLDNAISTKNIDSVLAIYSKDACLVTNPGEIANGIDEIAGYYKTLFSLEIPMTISTELIKTIQTAGLALVTTSWTLEGTDPEGNSGNVRKIANMVFRRNEGEDWLLLIDNPFGPEIVTSE